MACQHDLFSALPFVSAAAELTAAPRAMLANQVGERCDLPQHSAARPTIATERPAPATEADRPATLLACLSYLAASSGISPRLVTEARSDLAALARITGQPEAALPADPQRLRPILRDVLPAAHRISHKRWANIKATLTTVLLECGWVAAESRPRGRQTLEWASVLSLASRDLGRYQHAPLGPFARFCGSRGRPPETIESSDLVAYEEWRAARTLDLTPRQTAIGVSTAWRRLQAVHPELGLRSLGLASRVWRKAQPAAEFPDTFQRELAAYLEQMRHPDPLNPGHPRPYRELTVQHARRAILRSATYLVTTGTKPSNIESLAHLVTPDAFRTILGLIYKECGERWNDVAANISGNLLAVARYWVRPDPETLRELKTLRSRVRPSHAGLSRKVRDRLAQFSTDTLRLELFDLPGRGFEVADRMLRDGNTRGAAKQHEAALALAILLTQPLRLRNLASLDIERHLVRDPRHRLRRIVLMADEVKNRRDVDVQLPDDLAGRIEKHIRAFRPNLPGHDKGSALFPGPAGVPRVPESIGRIVRRLVERQIGARFTPHLARHLAVEMLLDDDPNNIVVAQRLLGHASPKTTASIYGITRTSAAQNKYLAIVDGMREKAAAREMRKSRRIP